MGIGAEVFADSALEDAHAMAVDDADAADGGEGGGVDEFVDVFDGFFGALADDVEFAVGDVEAGPASRYTLRGSFD